VKNDVRLVFRFLVALTLRWQSDLRVKAVTSTTKGGGILVVHLPQKQTRRPCYAFPFDASSREVMNSKF